MKTETARIIAELKAIQRNLNNVIEQVEHTLEIMGEKTEYRFQKMEVK